ncbi:MAG: hypothetical protein NTU44_18715 [Bacteroidetes bacterium]|nr:hypothetical protein [Bacteroidota bacterium]
MKEEKPQPVEETFVPSAEVIEESPADISSVEETSPEEEETKE